MIKSTAPIMPSTPAWLKVLMRKSFKIENAGQCGEQQFFDNWQRIVREYKSQRRIGAKRYRNKNPDSYRIANRKSYSKHTIIRRQYARQRRLMIKCDPIKSAALSENRNAYRSKRRLIDIPYRMRCVLRNRIKQAISGRYKKAESSARLLGCSIYEAMKHIESLWLPGMTWENNGVNGWHIDHRIPCAKFDLTNPEEQRKCFHYSNLQPLWSLDNLKKGAK